MSFIDIFLMTLRNLWRRKALTFLTVLGVIIGTACIVIMLGLGLGNEKAFIEQFSESGDLTQINVYDWGGGIYGGDKNKTKLDDNAIRSFYNIPGVKAATPVMNFSITLATGKYQASIPVTAVSVKVMKKNAFAVEQGVTLPESPAGRIDMILGYGTLYNFQRKNSTSYNYEVPDIDWLNSQYEMTLGYYYDSSDTSTPKSKKYKPSIVGIMPEENYGEFAYSAVMDLSDAKRLLEQNKKVAEYMSVDLKNYQQAYVYCNDMNAVMDVLKEIRETYGFEASSNTEWIKTQQEESNRQKTLFAAIGFIALLISAICIVITMLISVMERTREIGIMKVLGCPLIKINAMFLTEAATIGLLGGALGLGLSFIFKAVVAHPGSAFLDFLSQSGMGSSGGGAMQLIIPVWLALSAIGGAAVIGVLSGMYPAWRAMRMSPLAAIRSE